jgi:hypothetical protein
MALEQSVYVPENSGSLPGWLKVGDGGILYREDGKTSWDAVVDFGDNLESLRGEVSFSARDRFNHPLACFEESLAEGWASEPLANLSRLASPRMGNRAPERQQLYAANFTIMMRDVLANALAEFNDTPMIMAPERGGKIIKLMLEGMGVAATMPRYRASRNVVDGHYTVGLRFEDELPEATSVLFVDDCLAATGTERATHQYLTERFGQLQQYGVAAGVGAVRAVNSRASQMEQEGLDGFIWCGGEAHGMDDHYYLTLTAEERACLGLGDYFKQRVGDMGELMDMDSLALRKWGGVIKLLASTNGYDELVLESSREALGNRIRFGEAIREMKAELKV